VKTTGTIKQKGRAGGRRPQDQRKLSSLFLLIFAVHASFVPPLAGIRALPITERLS